ncbi:glutamate-5-semialdehyde dehydrogenase [Pararcticibacter amylolyticus]|uniref:Gamma-glutamyl phosphate reductase n=1 Tax=Pararcticibacter amylolyticus TaxID=2173175 RepID=A0A2U2PLN7_9SPHI|nr:glutamate-5-semialdehyde dehydrogenase [Pararcticibacter amylolyticus]PWG82089.1 glutamate-5-semialdehyde dehydrogenase [Pararcticibacter amylolyticus]
MELEAQFKNAAKAGRELNACSDDKINQILSDLAEQAVLHTGMLLEENQKDLARMSKDDPRYDRLKLTEKRILDIASDIRNVAGLSSPLGKVLNSRELPNGLKLKKVTVPLGVVGIIYEARPNVTFDVFSLCLKSGNIPVLKGGSDASFSNQAIISVIHQVLLKHHMSTSIATLLPPNRESTEALLTAVKYVDVIIPRGSQGLIDFVRQNSKVPVIETGAGIVHTYFDESGDAEKGRAIVNNAKTRRVSVCNALDCLVIHQSRLTDLPFLVAPLVASGVQIFADTDAYSALENKYPSDLLMRASEEHYGTEFLDYKLAVKTVAGIDQALDHISTYSSKHSEAIVSENEENTELFLRTVDAAAVYANASTAFTDGAQFGLGAEIGISTQKLHARGPMGLEELTSYKWMVKGDGHIRG